jgi:hypothetical protein
MSANRAIFHPDGRLRLMDASAGVARFAPGFEETSARGLMTGSTQDKKSGEQGRMAHP